MLPQRVARYIEDAEGGRFEDLALEAFAFQFARLDAYRALCVRRGATPGLVSEWRQVPATPTLAFKAGDLATAPAAEVFRSSGTTAERRSVHRQPYPELYRATLDASFPAACLRGLARPAILSLVPSRELSPDSSLSFMVDHVVARHGGEGSLWAIGPRGVETAAARGWLAARQRDGRPALVLATAFALLHLVEALARLDLRFRLPAGSVVFETGGTKGRTREVSRADLLRRVEEFLGVPPGQTVREYGMTELTSQFYTRALEGGDLDLFRPPHWTRVRVLDPQTLDEAPAGAPGLLAVFDLANLGTAVHLLTEDLGLAEDGGFRLLGRAAGADLRGCSLAAEELALGSG